MPVQCGGGDVVAICVWVCGAAGRRIGTRCRCECGSSGREVQGRSGWTSNRRGDKKLVVIFREFDVTALWRAGHGNVAATVITFVVAIAISSFQPLTEEEVGRCREARARRRLSNRRGRGPSFAFHASLWGFSLLLHPGISKKTAER